MTASWIVRREGLSVSEVGSKPSRHRAWATVLVSVVISAAVSAAVAWVVAGLTRPMASTVMDEGTATFLIRRGNERAECQVFYKIPFASPPKLTFPQGVGDDAELV